MPKNTYRHLRGGLTESGIVLLRMRYGQGVAKKQLAREFNVNVKHIRKYMKNDSLENIYTESPEVKKRMKKRRNLVKMLLSLWIKRGSHKWVFSQDSWKTEEKGCKRIF